MGRLTRINLLFIIRALAAFFSPNRGAFLLLQRCDKEASALSALIVSLKRDVKLISADLGHMFGETEVVKPLSEEALKLQTFQRCTVKKQQTNKKKTKQEAKMD